MNLLTVNAGCYTMSDFPVSNNDLSNIHTDNKIKIILNDKREVIVNNLYAFDRRDKILN